LITKYLFTGSLKNRSIDNLETQKKYISNVYYLETIVYYIVGVESRRMYII
jgi:hypothetical protein